MFQGGVVWQWIEIIDNDLVADCNVGEHVFDNILVVVLLLHVVLPLLRLSHVVSVVHERKEQCGRQHLVDC